MSMLIDKNNSSVQYYDDRSRDSKTSLGNLRQQTDQSVLQRFVRWIRLIKRRTTTYRKKPQGFLVFSTSKVDKEKQVMCLDEIPFIIPRRLAEVLQQSSTNEFEQLRLKIRRMDEYLVSTEDQDEAKRQRHYDTSLGLQALVSTTEKIQKVSFREVLSTDEILPSSTHRGSQGNDSVDHLLRQAEKLDPLTDFQEANDFIEFDNELAKHRKLLANKESRKPSDMLYLKFCLIFELQRDPNESCLRILLHDIIFKFHLHGFRLRCQIHVRKPIEHELLLEKVVEGSHLNATYCGQFIFYAADWIVQQEVELYAVIKVEPLSLNKYIGPKFSDIAHLHVKNVPHGASKIFLREMTPVCRPHKILSRGINVGQVEVEVAHRSQERQLLIRIVKVSHSQAERLLRAPETYVEVIFQDPFDIYDIQRTKIADRSLNPKFDEEFLFDIPERIAISDITVDLIFLEKSSLHHNPVVLGVLTLSKHTDWHPVRKFWNELEENPNVKLKNSFLFEGDLED